MLFKLLQGKRIPKLNASASSCYQIDLDNYPSMKDIEERADILSKLLIMHNREQYPTHSAENNFSGKQTSFLSLATKKQLGGGPIN